jgi:hypothetical protein
MARLTSDQAAVLQAAVDAGEPIPLEVFLASRDTDLPTVTDLDRFGTSDDDVMLSSAFATLRAAVDQWLSAQQEGRPDLHGASNKTIGARLEGELRAAVAVAFGVEVAGGSADLAALGVEVTSTRRDRPQAGILLRDPNERLTGVRHHLLLCVLDDEDDTVRVCGVVFIPRWRTADHRVVATANDVRRQLATRTIDWTEARRRLLKFGVDINRDPALMMPGAQPEGLVTLSPVNEWRVQFPRLVSGDLSPRLRLAGAEELPAVEHVEIDEFDGQLVLDLTTPML